MTVSSSVSSDDMLDMMWTHLLKRLTGTDPEYDSEVIETFSQALQIPRRSIVNKMRAHCYPGPHSLN
jgi:hypothetical protein